MDIRIITEKNVEKIEADGNTVQAAMRAMGTWLQEQTEFPLSWILEIEGHGSAEYAMKPRRGKDDGSTDIDDMHIEEVRYGIDGLLEGDVPATVELRCVEEGANKYKFYKMEPLPGENLFEATYGRIGGNQFGGQRRPVTYEGRLFWPIYAEKLLKGYVDQTAFLSGKKFRRDGSAVKPIRPVEGKTASASLFNRLLAYAQNTVREFLEDPEVTEEQAKRARELLDDMGSAKDLEEFNDKLRELLAISPRRIAGFKERGVASLMAKTQSAEAYRAIIDREESLVAAMEGVVAAGLGVEQPDEESFEDGFSRFGVTVKPVDIEKCEAADLAGMPGVDDPGDADAEELSAYRDVMKHLEGSRLLTKVREIWIVDDPAKQERFDEWLVEKGISRVKALWHGSRDENWLSTIEKGLLLNPNAVITGKMFGHGIYFSPSPSKSFNYTSHAGAYWSGGYRACGIMGLYATAYGDPHEVKYAQSFDQEQLDSIGCDCVHAKRGGDLRNDEIVFYDERAMVLKYLVVFE